MNFRAEIKSNGEPWGTDGEREEASILTVVESKWRVEMSQTSGAAYIKGGWIKSRTAWKHLYTVAFWFTGQLGTAWLQGLMDQLSAFLYLATIWNAQDLGARDANVCLQLNRERVASWSSPGRRVRVPSPDGSWCKLRVLEQVHRFKSKHSSERGRQTNNHRASKLQGQTR